MSKKASTGGLFGRADGSRAPLAARMRPASFDEMVGQQHLVGPGTMLRRAIDDDRLPSVLLYGPAGSGKSTLARIIASVTHNLFVEMSAVSSGVADIREAARQAIDARGFHDRGTIVFIDEIHRLAKNQQDALLPHVEAGAFTLIGATTENPFYTVIAPLRSRCQLYSLEPLEPDDVRSLVGRALSEPERGLGGLQLSIAEEALQHLIEGGRGDARATLNALELAALSVASAGSTEIGLEDVEEALQRPVLKYDRAGDEHYDTISAFIKSMRGSDPDATIYWLAKMLEAGEDPEFIARRIVIQAAEDVGLADPTALRVAISAADAVKYIGMPEAQLVLAMAALHVAVAPKSNSAYKAIKAAREEVRKQGAERVPGHLAGGARVDNDSAEYLYPHDYQGGWVKQQYLPPGLEGRRYYEPGDNARERRIAEHLETLRGAGTDNSASGETAGEDGTP